MIKQRLVSIFLATLMVGGQLAWPLAAAADESSPTPTATEEATPTPTPEATATPTPTPTATPEPSVSPEASASPSPSASPEATPKPKITDIGPNGCGGVVPSWVFDTVSGKWVAADKGSFSCDMASGYYLSPKYFYDKHSGWYKIMPPEVAKPDYVITAPNVVHTVLGDLVVGSQDYNVAKSLGLLDPGTGGIVLSNTGADSNNQATVTNSGQTWLDLTNLVNVINTLQSNATTGGVAATSNTQAGNLSTGTASVLANVINLLASAWSWSNGSLSFFMQNFFGDHNGDLNLTPSESAVGGGGGLGGSATTSNTGPGSNNSATTDNSNALNVNAKNSGTITNNLDLNALSGDATASGNTAVGNVATGDAIAEVNIINLINSFINSGSSFFGILNLFGNFNGDILFPTGFLNGLVPSSSIPTGGTATLAGTGPDSTNQAAVNNNNQTTVNNSSALGVNNNVQTTAASGSATADQNTGAGNVSTGQATTQQSLFNMANSSIFGDNAVLVIVNVLGHWVGKIMTLPGSSSTSALLTGNATVGSNGTGPDSTNQTAVNNTNTANINQSSVGSITNNVNVNAQSGDATATKNTAVGDVTTGTAKAASNVANLYNSVLNVKHWFGVLIINVFGDWVGDVNHDSDAGNAPGKGSGSANSGAAAAQAAATTLPSVGLLTFLKPATASVNVNGTGAAVADVANDSTGKVLTAAVNSAAAQETSVAAAQNRNLNFMFILSAIVLLVAGALMAAERKVRR